MRYRYEHEVRDPKVCDSDVFEVEQRMSDEPFTHCPKCRWPVVRIIEAGQRPIARNTPLHHT